ncbi:uncharacterized protein [Amphiura filiformis]|uniref:uncharacterized protein n=1 Tax=Amphiura filiformis TaxID=82378 RepID=UPI003B20B84E
MVKDDYSQAKQLSYSGAAKSDEPYVDEDLIAEQKRRRESLRNLPKAPQIDQNLPESETKQDGSKPGYATNTSRIKTPPSRVIKIGTGRGRGRGRGRGGGPVSSRTVSSLSNQVKETEKRDVAPRSPSPEVKTRASTPPSKLIRIGPSRGRGRGRGRGSSSASHNSSEVVSTGHTVDNNNLPPVENVEVTRGRGRGRGRGGIRGRGRGRGTSSANGPSRTDVDANNYRGRGRGQRRGRGRGGRVRPPPRGPPPASAGRDQLVEERKTPVESREPSAAPRNDSVQKQQAWAENENKESPRPQSKKSQKSDLPTRPTSKESQRAESVKTTASGKSLQNQTSDGQNETEERPVTNLSKSSKQSAKSAKSTSTENKQSAPKISTLIKIRNLFSRKKKERDEEIVPESPEKNETAQAEESNELPQQKSDSVTEEETKSEEQAPHEEHDEKEAEDKQEESPSPEGKENLNEEPEIAGDDEQATNEPLETPSPDSESKLEDNPEEVEEKQKGFLNIFKRRKSAASSKSAVSSKSATSSKTIVEESPKTPKPPTPKAIEIPPPQIIRIVLRDCETQTSDQLDSSVKSERPQTQESIPKNTAQRKPIPGTDFDDDGSRPIIIINTNSSKDRDLQNTIIEALRGQAKDEDGVQTNISEQAADTDGSPQTQNSDSQPQENPEPTENSAMPPQVPPGFQMPPDNFVIPGGFQMPYMMPNQFYNPAMPFMQTQMMHPFGMPSYGYQNQLVDPEYYQIQQQQLLEQQQQQFLQQQQFEQQQVTQQQNEADNNHVTTHSQPFTLPFNEPTTQAQAAETGFEQKLTETSAQPTEAGEQKGERHRSAETKQHAKTDTDQLNQRPDSTLQIASPTAIQSSERPISNPSPSALMSHVSPIPSHATDPYQTVSEMKTPFNNEPEVRTFLPQPSFGSNLPPNLNSGPDTTMPKPDPEVIRKPKIPELMDENLKKMMNEYLDAEKFNYDDVDDDFYGNVKRKKRKSKRKEKEFKEQMKDEFLEMVKQKQKEEKEEEKRQRREARQFDMTRLLSLIKTGEENVPSRNERYDESDASDSSEGGTKSPYSDGDFEQLLEDFQNDDLISKNKDKATDNKDKAKSKKKPKKNEKRDARHYARHFIDDGLGELLAELDQEMKEDKRDVKKVKTPTGEEALKILNGIEIVDMHQSVPDEAKEDMLTMRRKREIFRSLREGDQAIQDLLSQLGTEADRIDDNIQENKIFKSDAKWAKIIENNSKLLKNKSLDDREEEVVTPDDVEEFAVRIGLWSRSEVSISTSVLARKLSAVSTSALEESGSLAKIGSAKNLLAQAQQRLFEAKNVFS